MVKLFVLRVNSRVARDHQRRGINAPYGLSISPVTSPGVTPAYWREKEILMRQYGILIGTSLPDLKVSFKSKLDFEIGTRIVQEFGFSLARLPNDATDIPESEFTHFEYSHEFRVFCCKEAYPE